jgi:Holliday junction resolvasome RuvABC endonuclease subunit
MDVVTAMGIDPGWAKCGIGAIHRFPDGSLKPGGVRLVKTGPNKDKRFEKLRVSMDDERRLREYYTAFCDAIQTVKPKVIGVECYTIFENANYTNLRSAAAKFLAFLGFGGRPAPLKASELIDQFRNEDVFTGFLTNLLALKDAVDKFKAVRGRGAAAKTQMVYAAALCAAYQYNVPVYVFMPVDLKKAMCKRASATKKDVEDALCGMIPGLREEVDKRIGARTMHEHVFDAVGHGYLGLQTWEKWMGDSGLTAAS